MEESIKKINDYILNISKKINESYPNLINNVRILKIIEMFRTHDGSYEEKVKEVDKIFKKIVVDYVEEIKERAKPELVKINHQEIFSKLETLVRKMNAAKIDYQLSGALCAYIKYGIESKRTHDDIDINLNEADIDKFKQVCLEMGLNFYDNRLNSPRILENDIPVGGHEVIATLDNSNFHIGAFCFERKPEGNVIYKGYYRDENNHPCCKHIIFNNELSKEIFGYEKAYFNGQMIYITPPEYIYVLKQNIQKNKDILDLNFMENKIDKGKLNRINFLSLSNKIEFVKL